MRLSSGDRVELSTDEDEGRVLATLVASKGWGEIFSVKTMNGGHGLVLFKPNGKWWWVIEPDNSEPWECS